MASFILKGLVTNDGIDRSKCIDRLRNGNQRREHIVGEKSGLFLKGDKIM